MNVHAFNRLNQQAMILAAEAIQSEDFNLLNQLGLENLAQEEVDSLKSLSLNHLVSTESFKGTLCEVKFNRRQLRLFIDFASNKNNEDDLINKAIKAGLRQPMLKELKGIGRREFNERRRRMGMPEHNKGRIENLNENDELTVLRAWKNLESNSNDKLEKLLTLYNETQISLDRAWLAIRSSNT